VIPKNLWRLSRVKINSLANIARVILGLPLSLFFTYFVLKKITLTDYGTWVLLISFFSYFSFFDLGMSTAVTRFISYHHARKETLIINKILNTSLVFYLIIGFLITFSLFCLKTTILTLFFKSADKNLLALGYVFNLVILMGYLDFVFSTFQGAINGFQRMDISSLVDLTKTILLTVFGYFLLSWQATLNNLVLAFVLMTTIWALISLFSCRLIFNNFSLGLGYVDKIIFKKMFKFSFQTQFSSLSFYVHFNFDKFLISYYLGLDKVAYLDIALKLINQCRLLTNALISPILPAAAEKIVLFKNKVYDFYRTSFRYVVFFASFIFGGLFLISPIFIRLWLGPGFEMAITTTQILAIGHFMNMLTGPGGSILLAQGKPTLVMLTAIADMLANIVLSIIGIYLFGFYGTVSATSFSLLVSGIVFIIIAPRFFDMRKDSSKAR
jgi:O-antigen/teichoic acid export membrane protein